MDYRKAQGLKNKGLWSLIAEKKFEEGKSIRSSVGGAISDKFKAKMTRTKEKFDPLNILSSIVGKKNIFGKSITTAAGRAFGRSEADIGYFGGYRRKGGNRKDPRRTTIGPGPIKALRIGDSTADILAKTYNFMEKTHKAEMKRYELEKTFREEQMQEDERRHNKLIEQLTNTKAVPKSEPKKDEDKEPSFIDKMLDGMKSALGFILSPIKKILGFFGSVLSGVVKGIESLALKFTEILGKTALETFTSIFPFIEKYVVGSLGFMMKYIFKSLIKTFAAFNGVSGALGKALQIGLAAFGMLEAADAYFDYQSLINYGSQAEKTMEEYLKLKEKYDDLEKQIRVLEQNGTAIDSLEMLSLKKQQTDLIPDMKKLSDKANVERGQYAQQILIPHMESKGYEYDRYNKDEKKDGLPRFKNKKGEILLPYGPEMLEAAGTLPIQQFGKKTVNDIIDGSKTITGKIGNDVSTFIQPLQNELDDFKLKLENLEDYFNVQPSTIINNSTNSIGSSQETQDTTTISLRDLNLSYNNRMNYAAV